MIAAGLTATATSHASAVPAGPVLVRRAEEDDRAALAEMFDRCSAQTRYRRFHGHVNALPRRYLAEALAGGPAHFALVACPGAGRVVALASSRTDADGVAEVGILVEDAYQRLGIGSVLLREIACHASRAGLTTLKAQLLGEQSWIVRLLSAYGSCESAYASGVLDVTVRLSDDPGGAARLREHGDLTGAVRGEGRPVPP